MISNYSAVQAEQFNLSIAIRLLRLCPTLRRNSPILVERMVMTQGESLMPEKVENKTAEAIQSAPQQEQPQIQVEVDDTHVMASYSNFCRVTGSPEELI